MNFASRYPLRTSKYIACDCNVASSDKNTTAWIARIALARSEGGRGPLANQTVDRWFTAASVKSQTKATSDVRRMILSASLKGFVDCVAALCDFDLPEKVKAMKIPGLYVVGQCDGVLPAAMARFAQTSPLASFVEIADAGHLPMIEQSEAFLSGGTGLARVLLKHAFDCQRFPNALPELFLATTPSQPKYTE